MILTNNLIKKYKMEEDKLLNLANFLGEQEKKLKSILSNPRSNEDVFLELCKPIMKYLCENHHPHTTIVITQTNAELLEVISGTARIEDFIN